jgi:hypothetical protein|tara:strand:- start:204 stop:524 length:321 start_codon:yes stop_codon:yes gene_type:complete
MKHISEIIKQIKDKNPHWVEYNKTQLKNYYCENCGDDDLDTPIDDGTGSIFCSKLCLENSLQWRSEDIKKYINPKEIEREQKQDSQLDILFKKSIPNYYNNKYKTK